MTQTTLLFIGIALGVAFSAPVGPVNILCIQKAFQRGFPGGVAAGLGAVFADGLYAALAAYGTTAAGAWIAERSSGIQTVGGGLILIFGWRILTARPMLDTSGDRAGTLLSTALSSFGLTITNPAAGLGFAALFGSMGSLAPQPGDFAGATLLVIGVILGGSAWWVLVSAVVAAIRGRLTAETMRRVNQTAGVALILLGVVLVARGLAVG